MIAAVLLGGAPGTAILQGSAVYWVVRNSQHAGIAAEDGEIGRPLTVYASTSDSLTERWDDGELFHVVAVGWMDRDDGVEVRGNVLIECRRVEYMIRDRVGWPPLSDERPRCCQWQIRHPYRLLTEDEEVIFAGSCSGFVEHCYEVAGIDLVAEGDGPGDLLPLTGYDDREPDYIKFQYMKAGGTIRRLYPSYQIRAFQLDEYPWVPDLRYRWFPDGFEADASAPAP